MKHLAIQGVIRGKVKKQPSRIRANHVQKTRVTGRSGRLRQTCCGSATLLTSRSGRESSTLLLSSIPSRIRSWVSVFPTRQRQTFYWIHWKTLHDRRPVHKIGLSNHSDRGGQYLFIRYTERLADAGIDPSVGSVGNSYDTALAQTHQRSVQGRSHSPARTLENHGRCRMGDPQIGKLVQQPSPACINRIHPAI